MPHWLLRFGAQREPFGSASVAQGMSGCSSRSGLQSKYLDDQVPLFVDFDYKPILFYKKAVEAAQSEAFEIELN
jgi:hypothetical protein